MKQYEKRTPGLFKVETIKDKVIALCSKMYCCINSGDEQLIYSNNLTDEEKSKIKFSCKGIQKDGNEINYKFFENVSFGDKQDTAHNKGFRMVEGTMKSYEQDKKGLSYVYCKRIVLPDGINTVPLNI